MRNILKRFEKPILFIVWMPCFGFLLFVHILVLTPIIDSLPNSFNNKYITDIFVIGIIGSSGYLSAMLASIVMVKIKTIFEISKTKKKQIYDTEKYIDNFIKKNK